MMPRKKRNQVQIKVFSKANVLNTTTTVHLQDEKDHQMKDITGFVSCKYNRKQ
jgi:hypothetical protein